MMGSLAQQLMGAGHINHNQLMQAMQQQQYQGNYQLGGMSNMCGVPITYAPQNINTKDPLTLLEKIKKEEKKSMFKSVSDDMKSFLRENKTIIYSIALVLIIDHYFFENAFREKLKNMVHRLIGKVEAHLDLPPAKDNKS